MSHVGFTPEQVDDMELWVIAEILDAHFRPSDRLDPLAPDETGEGTPMTQEEFDRMSRRLIAQRMAQAEAAGMEVPPPTMTV